MRASHFSASALSCGFFAVFLRSGQAQDVEDKTLLLLQNGVSDDVGVQTRLLLAYLHDKIEANPLSATVSINLLNEPDVLTRLGESSLGYKKGTPWDGALDRRAAEAIRSLVELMPSNRRLRNLVVSLAAFARGK